MAQPVTSRTPTTTGHGGRGHRSGLVTLLFTDMVGSTALKQRLGDHASSAFFDQHHRIVRETLAEFPGGLEIETAGDSFLITFDAPSDAVQFALLLQSRLKLLAAEQSIEALDRIGIYVGEVVIKDVPASAKPRDLYGIPIDICARIMGLASGGQTLLGRMAFDAARAMLRDTELGALQWLNHGPYQLKGIDEPIEVCEVRLAGNKTAAPITSDKASRIATENDLVLGWRPALDQLVPATRWKLIAKLGEGGFGEVWLGQHEVLKEKRVFKFCFRADRVRSLKREMTLFRVIKERIGEHPNIVALREVYFDQPPYYVEMDHVDGKDLRGWCEARGGVEKIPLEARLEIVAQVADALQAAHESGVIHRDIKPGNILVANPKPDSHGAPSVHTKLTDFGIGQVVSAEALGEMTRAGFTETLMSPGSGYQTGTHLYMAPELLVGEPASPKSDIYSLGVVLYQLVAGAFNRPLTSEWAQEVTDPFLREDIAACVSGKSQQRFPNAGELARRLRALPERRAAAAARQRSVSRKRFALAAAAIVLLGAIAWFGASHLMNKKRLAQLDRDLIEALRLVDENRLIHGSAKYIRARALANNADRYIPSDPRIQKIWEASSITNRVFSDPPGATIRVKPYDNQDAEWEVIGQTPIEKVYLPRTFLLVRFEKPGFAPVDAVWRTSDNDISRQLDPEASIPNGMVRVDGDTNVPSFFLDRFEVTNRRYKEFVDAGGYKNPKLWKEPFLRDGKEVPFETAITTFRDSTGQPGPATWAAGAYPAGRDDFPVSGVSWHEASAYAEFAGKSLPTYDHWRRAAGVPVSATFPTFIAQLSNFSQTNAAAVGMYKAMTPFGNMDMSGNVREWCFNQSQDGKHISGGAWDDVSYTYLAPAQQSPWNRSPKNGFRCASYIDRSAIPALAFAPKEQGNVRDFGKEQPVSDSVYESYLSRFQYDRTDLKPKLEERDEKPPHWIMEKVSFDAAYDNDRVLAWLFIPRNAKKPYQSVIYFPGSLAVGDKSAQLPPLEGPGFLVRNGRVLVWPVYHSTYERSGTNTWGNGKFLPHAEFRNSYPDRMARWVKDLRRTIDYLETRPDFDPQKIAFNGNSWGGMIGLIIPAVEPRLKASILTLGGFDYIGVAPPEAQSINFVSRIKVPTLMLNGKYDLRFPLDKTVLPAFAMLGLPEKDKKLVIYDSSHFLPPHEREAESLAWLDKYLGPVK